ncbi:multidrug resistance protein MdtG-like isoform X2 [Apostichopus japonicus]
MVYFIYIASLAVVRPYVPVFMFELGMNAFQVGILRCLEPLTSFLTSPVWGSIADRFNVHRILMVFTAVGSSLCIPLMLLVPPVDYFEPIFFNESDWRNQSRVHHVKENPIQGYHDDIFPWFSLTTFCLMALLMFVNNSFIAGFVPLLDANTIQLCKKYPGNSYGGQRWLGAFAVIIFSPIAGLMVDSYASIQASIGYDSLYFLQNHYLLSFTMVTLLGLLSIIPLLKMEMISKSSPESFSNEVREIFKSPDVMMTFILVLIVGSCKGIVGAFLFIFLRDLGASKLLMGTTLIVTCLTEVPCLVWSKKVIDKFGCPAIFCLGLFAYVIRLLGYSVITEPWQVLPIETLHGICYGLLWANCTEYANRIAPDGMAATLQSIMHATKAGVGEMLGVILGGLLYERNGARVMFQTSALVAAVTLVAYSIHLFVFYRNDASGPRTVKRDWKIVNQS